MLFYKFIKQRKASLAFEYKRGFLICAVCRMKKRIILKCRLKNFLSGIGVFGLISCYSIRVFHTALLVIFSAENHSNGF